MIRYLFIIPLLLSIIWLLYLRLNGWSIRQGYKGFVYIAVISAVIAAFYTAMMFLTGR